MIDCGEARVLVEKLSDGEATTDEKRAAESHLEECSSCRSHLEFLLWLSQEAKEAQSMPFPEPPESYWEHLPRRVLDRIDSERVERARGGFWSGLLAPAILRWAALGATLLVLVTVGVAVLREDARTLAPPPPVGTREESPAQARGAAQPSAEPTAPPPMARDEAAPSRAKGSSDALSRVAEPAVREAIPEAPPPAAPAETANAPKEPKEIEAQKAQQDERERRKENAPALEKAARPQAAAAPAMLSREAAPESCDELRRAVAAMDGGPDRNDARYRLAICSLDRHARKQSEELRKLAIEDAEGFLSVEGQGPRADEIRGRLERIRPDGGL